jgi:Sulfotransferase family
MKDPSPRVSQKVCFIAGAGHSGSTLLGFILGSHANTFYCGEAAKTRFLQDKTKRTAKRVCKLCGENCRIWKDFKVNPAIDLYEQIAVKTGKSIIIDSAKSVDWINQQLEDLKHTSTQPFLIFLQRDGRAVINSRIRKYPDKNVKDLIEDWSEQVRQTNALFDRFSSNKIKFHYEYLASNPAIATQKICDFLQIEYQPEMLNYDQHEHHVLGGNDGTQFLVAKTQSDRLKNPFVTLSERNKYYYEQRDAKIVLDLRWQQELDVAVQHLFEELAGQVNQELKWDV